MLQIMRRWVRTGFAPLALLILGVAGGCRLEPYWDGRPMAGPKNPTCYPENEWGGFYPTCWRQWPECAPRCKKESDLAASVEEGAPEKSPPFSSETPTPEKPKTAPEANKPDAAPAVKPQTKPAAPKPPAPAPAPLKTSSNDAMPETNPAEPTRDDAPAKDDEAAVSPDNDGWLTVEEKPSEGGQPDSNWKPAVRQTAAGE